MMNIVFTGYRGSGKTTISTRLCEIIGWERIETDQELELSFNMNIPEIVKKYGWKKFRATEKKHLKKCCRQNMKIIDLGGGAILNEDVIKRLRKNSLIIFLDCSLELLVDRIRNDSFRPALTNLTLEQEINHVLIKRLPLYLKYSDVTINTGVLTPDQCCRLILFHVRNHMINQEQDTFYNTNFVYA